MAITGTAAAGTTTSITLASGASSVDDFYNGMFLTGTDGTNSGETGQITDYVGSTKVATLHKTFDTAWDDTSDYSISPEVSASLRYVDVDGLPTPVEAILGYTPPNYQPEVSWPEIDASPSQHYVDVDGVPTPVEDL